MTSDPQSERDRELRELLVNTSSAEGSAHRKRANPWIVGVTGVVVVAALTGAAVATSSIVATFHEIPHSTHRAPDPVTTSPGPALQAPDTGSVAAQDSPLDQLWAISKGDPIPADQSNPQAWQVDEFANAIRVRCFPQLTTTDRTQLTHLYSEFKRTLQERPLVVPQVRAAKNAYFERATTLCM
jgi:hypothetical protein